MTHDELRDLHELYVLGVLDGEEKIELEQHLATNCPQCAAGLRKALRFSSMLGTLPEAVEPSRDLRRRVLASVGLEPKGGRWWLGALAALSACLLIGVVVLSLDDTRRKDELATVQTQLRQTANDRSRMEEVLRFLNEPETKQVVFGEGQVQPPRGRIFVNPRGVALIAANLPPAGAGKTYEMWLVPKTGAPVPAGLFQSDAQGNALYLRTGAVDLSGTKAIAVSVEPASGSQTPTTVVFAAGLSE
jgi:anti-sigma-K factor RskA